MRFIPKENGPHLVYVSFDGCQIPDSPFRIQVGTVHADPGMVQAYGDGLKTGKTGGSLKEISFLAEFLKVSGLHFFCRFSCYPFQNFVKCVTLFSPGIIY